MPPPDTPHALPTSDRPTRRPWRRLAIGATSLVLIAAVTTAGLGLWRLTWLAPRWWADPDPKREQTIVLADRVEYRLAEETHKIRPDDGRWRLRITDEQVNAWLATRLQAWFAHTHGLAWPAGLGTPQIHFTDGAVNVGLDFEDDGRRRYLVADLVPRVVDGRLAVVLDGVALGRLRIPGGSMRTLMETYRDVAPDGFLDDPSVRRVVDLLIDAERVDPTITLADGRRVRVVELVAREGELIVLCATKIAGNATDQ